MLQSKLIKILLVGGLLVFSNFSIANSTHNIYMMTLSILSYVKWNNPPATLCILENNYVTQQFSSYLKSQNLAFTVKDINSNDVKSTNCDAIFFSNTTPAIEQKLINIALTQSILSFSTSNNECEIGSVFCLNNAKNGNTVFKVNLDSLARSKVHVDPRVLLLAKNSE